MKKIIVGLAAVGLLSLTACNEKKATLKSDDDKTIYAIGLDFGEKLKQLSLNEREVKVLVMGVSDSALGKKAQVEKREFLSKGGELIRGRQKVAAENEKKDADAFIAKAKAMPNAQTSESGLVIVSTQEGSGEMPKATDRVKVNYHGTLRDGSVFDSTRERKQPASFRLDRVIPCWKEGVQKIKVGGKAELYCPSAIAYGDRGAPPKIPPGAALKFEVELLEIIKEEKPAAKK